MEIINDTPFNFGLLPGRIFFPEHSLTLMVKGTFDLGHQKSPGVSEEQAFPEGDVFYEGDDEGKGSVFYESDFAYAKTSADCFLVGHCQGAEAARVRRVDFKIGDRLKSLAVFGERQWTGGNTMTEPQFFDAIPLRYEYALGGDGFEENPVGKGATNQQAQGYVLPNIEYADQLMQSPNSRPPLAGFGAINRNWAPRNRKLGTYTNHYVKERWPWFPEDFDWSYFNSSPVDQQIKPFLQGDESMIVTSMHRDHELFETKLPGLRVRLFVSTTEIPNVEYFSEVKTNLDTLWVNMDDLTMRLVWRGWLKVSNDEYPELQHCFVFAEPTTINTPVNVVFERFNECWLELQDDEDAPEGEATPEQEQAEIKAALDEARQALRAQLIGMGLDPKNVDDALAPGEEELNPKSPPKLWNRELFMMALQERRDFSQEDLNGVDLSGLTLTGVNFQEADLTEANFQQCKLQNCDFSQAILSKANFNAAQLNQVAMVGADLFSASFQNAYLGQVDMSGCFADEACFDGAQAQQWVMAEASVSNASLQGVQAPGSDFSATDFSYSNLSQASLHQSNLAEASIEGATAQQVNLMLADLTQLKASEGLDAQGGNFCQVLANASIWEEANLAGCNFTYAQLQGATLNKANLSHADISAADLKVGKLMGADLTATKAVMINFFEGTFEKAKLIQTDLRGANLYGAEFLEADIQQPLLEQANLHATKLAGTAGTVS
ncbi:MAG: DUF2169 domain-containing protein [Pseudomonadales bacterium]|nr:DUF2169 domain-containing protein [Pseudomonadales bacterium]